MPREMTVKKAELIKHLTEERTKHTALYEEAVENYRKRAIAEMEKQLADAKAGQPIRLHISIPVPEEHTEDYDAAIAQLEWEIEDQVTLDENEFNTLVLGQWGWMRAFTANSLSYTASAAR